MSRKHYSKSDFIITEQGNGIQVGYCQKCHGDMQILRDGILRHYNSHQTYKNKIRLIKV